MCYWTPEEEEFVLNNYRFMTAREMGEQIGKSPKAINQKLRQRGITDLLDGHTLLHLEDKTKFCELYPKLPNTELVKIFPYLPLDSVRSIAHKLGVKKDDNFSCTRRYTDEELLTSYRRVYDSLGRCPTEREFLLWELPSPIAYRHHFGSFKKVCEILGVEYRAVTTFMGGREVLRTIDGDSAAEETIGKIVTELGYEYVHGVLYRSLFGISDFGQMKVDWYLPQKGIVIEYFGLPEKPEYAIKMRKKQELCQRYGIPLISIYPKNLLKSKEEFKNFIVQQINQVS